MSNNGESGAWSREEFDYRRGMYLHEYPIGADHGTVTVPLDSVVAPVSDRYDSSLPGIQIEISDFGLPHRRLVVEGSFPPVQGELFGMKRPHCSSDFMIVRWGAGRYQSEDDRSKGIEDGGSLLFVVPRDQWSESMPMRNDTLIVEANGYVAEDDVAILAMQRYGNELAITLRPELLGRIAYFAMMPPNQAAMFHETSDIGWLTKLGVQRQDLPDGVFDKIQSLLNENSRLEAELAYQKNAAGEKTSELRAIIRRLREALDGKQRIINELTIILNKRNNEKRSEASRGSASTTRATKSSSESYCRTLGIDQVFFDGLPNDQKIKLVKSARRQVAALLHPDRGGDEDAFKAVNQAADSLIAVLESQTR